ncbi:MAG TPA: crossover junction endodeoxyribonuclease RuvC, partial [Anaerolineae bacterium]|nr:crossover junction endodeoxyribonuclease RuvC [Anaerolineae bacterium]
DGEMTVVAWGTIRTTPDMEMPDRLMQIHTEMCALLVKYRPDTAGVEEVFFGRNITTAITVGQARGVILLSLTQAGVSVGEYSPPKIKQSVAGYGKADKKQVQLMVRHLLDLEETPRPDDAADGLAIAITHYNYYHFNALTR